MTQYNQKDFSLVKTLITLGIKRNTEGDSPKYLIDNKDKKNVILSKSKGSHNKKILRLLCSFIMTWGKGVNVFSLLFSSHLNVCQKYNVILNFTKRTNELASCVSLYAQVRSSQKIQDLSSYRFRLGGRNDSDRKELINLSTYPLINFQKAFTLAEILITLGIIGIVATMTIPNLIQKNYEHQTIAKLKETHSILSQAIRMASEEYGEPSGWDIFGASEEKAIKFMNNIKPFIKIATDCGTYDEEGKCMTKGPVYQMNQKTIWSNSYAKARNYYKFCLMNGSCLWFRTATQNEYVNNKGFIGVFFIDANGPKQPNAFGRDVFNFTIQNDVLIPEGCDKNYNYYKISCKDKNSVGNGCACYINLNNNMNYLHTK